VVNAAVPLGLAGTLARMAGEQPAERSAPEELAVAGPKSPR
jgi:hypothetical protein